MGRSAGRRLPPALLALPNVGPATAGDLVRLGIESPEQLAAADPQVLYQRLNLLDGRVNDPCVLDVFRAAHLAASGGPALPWWHFSRIRKSGPGV